MLLTFHCRINANDINNAVTFLRKSQYVLYLRQDVTFNSVLGRVFIEVEIVEWVVTCEGKGKEKWAGHLDLSENCFSLERCAMALLHSRIRRVFYGCADNVQGALGSRYKIHTQTGLNHHFEVFYGILEDDCRHLFPNYEKGFVEKVKTA